jgi:hypothetical protein
MTEPNWNTGKHSWNVDYVKTISRDEFIAQCAHLDPNVAGAEYDKIVPPTTKKEKQ